MSNRVAILVAVLLVGGFGFAFHKLALSERYAEQAALDERIAAQQETAGNAAQQLAGARAARDDYAANSAALIELGKAIPSDPDVGALVYQLQAEARRAGVQLRTYTRTQDEAAAGTASPTAGGATAIPLQLTFRGDFFGLDQLLRRIRSFVRLEVGGISGRLLVVDSLDLAPDNDDTAAAGTMTATVGVTAYMRSAGDAAAAPLDAAATTGEAAPAPAGTAPAAAPGAVDQ